MADGDRRRDRNTGQRRNLDRIAAEELRAAVRARLSVYGEFRSISSAIASGFRYSSD